LINNFNWSLEDIENCIFWERDIYLKLVADYEEKKKQKQMQKMTSGDYFNL
jgi:hypothetical protein